MKGRPRVHVQPCKYCSKEFKRQEHLDRHLRTHTQEKPFGCVCGRMFSRQDLLHRHQRLSQCSSVQTTDHNGPASTSDTAASISPSISSGGHELTLRYPAAQPGTDDASDAGATVMAQGVVQAPNYSRQQQAMGRFSVSALPPSIGQQDNGALGQGSSMGVSMDVSIHPPMDPSMKTTMETPDINGQAMSELDLDFLSNETDMLNNYIIGMFPTADYPHQLPESSTAYGVSPEGHGGYMVGRDSPMTGTSVDVQAFRFLSVDQVSMQSRMGPSAASLGVVATEKSGTSDDPEEGTKSTTNTTNPAGSEEAVDDVGDPLDASLDALDDMADDLAASNPWLVSPATRAQLEALVRMHTKLVDSDASTDTDASADVEAPREEPFRLPSRHVLSRYITSFVRSFHPHLPFLHLGTTRLDTMEPMLLMTLSATGTFYAFEHTHGYAMYAVAKSIVLQALERRRRARTSHLLRSFPKYAEMPMLASPAADTMASVETVTSVPEQSTPGTRATTATPAARIQSEPVDLALLQSLLVIVLTMSWLDKPLMEDALAMSSQLTELLRDALAEEEESEGSEENGRFEEGEPTGEEDEEDEEETRNAETTSDKERDEDDWRRWGRREERLRTLYSAFFVLNILTICFEIPHPLRSAAVDLALPSSEAEFAAPTRAAWLRLRSRGQRRSQKAPRKEKAQSGLGGGGGGCRPRFLDCLHRLLTGQLLAKEVAESEYGNYLLVQTLLIHIKREKQTLIERLVPLPSSPPALSTNIVGMYAGALDAWQAGWDSAIDTSPLDPNSVHGPLAFNATAMLRLAHAELVLSAGAGGASSERRSDHLSYLSGPGGHLRCRNPRVLALGWPGPHQPPPPRLSLQSPHVSQAVLHAISALRIPVRVGIPFMARGRTGHWSVQHALSTYTCAQLLVHWLEAIYEVVRDSVQMTSPDSTTTAVGSLAGLRHDERRLLSMVERLIEETHLAEFVGRRGSYPGRIRRLAAAALKLWADTCKGIQVFEIVHVVGATLSVVAEGIESKEQGG